MEQLLEIFVLPINITMPKNPLIAKLDYSIHNGK